MITEKEYIARTSVSHRKKFAQFFTPETISDFMAEWVVSGISKNAEILEPAFGLGIFSRSIRKLSPNVITTGYDIDEVIYNIAKQNFANDFVNIILNNEDYLTSSWDSKYDAIICNPPYLKFHDYDNAILVPYINERLKIHLNGFTNIYTLFLLKSISQLKEGGRLAYIVPSEFLNADYGVEVKRILLKSGTLRHFIIIDFNQCAFDDALTTACIILCEKTTPSESVRFSNIGKIEDLCSALKGYIEIPIEQLDPQDKWSRYYNEVHSSKYQHLVPFSTFAKVSRGIATGANEYFTFKASKIDEFSIPRTNLLPCICHSVDVTKLIFNDEDYSKLVQNNKLAYLFNGCADENNIHVQRYIQLGVELGINHKYLTASRNPWYAIENRKPSPIWVSVFNRNGLRFIRNKSGVHNLTTFHCVYCNDIVDTDILFTYLITDLAKEIFLDNSRQYGNGLIKFEPNDINKGKVVDLRILSDEEKSFLKTVYRQLLYHGNNHDRYVRLLDTFYRTKYSNGLVNIKDLYDSVCLFDNKNDNKESIREPKRRFAQLNFMDLFEQYADSPIVNNSVVRDNGVDALSPILSNRNSFGLSKNVLVALVKDDNVDHYLNQTAEIYYTGKRFPSTVALNNLFYFMPYIKGKGIQDLYLIKIVRIGSRKEGQPDNDPNDLRLVFEIEFQGSVFDDYKQIDLKIWRTFTETTMSEILKLKD